MAEHTCRRLEEKVAIITGAASGLGRATAELFAREGARVVLADIDLNAASKAAQSIAAEGGEAMAHPVDVSQSRQVDGLVARCAREYGKVDIMVNNAGTTGSEPIIAITDTAWHRMIEVNLSGTMYGMRAAWPYVVQTRGLILNVASFVAFKPMPGYAAYSAAKAGVIQLTRVAALEGAAFGVRVNAVCPGIMRTPMTLRPEMTVEERVALEQAVTKDVPPGRLGEPNDVAAAALYLASEEARFVTGIALPVDGGLMVRW